jgi:hypothetical protein
MFYSMENLFSKDEKISDGSRSLNFVSLIWQLAVCSKIF